MQSLFQIEIIYKPAKDETIVFSRSIPIPQKGSDPLNQTKLLFPLIFISREDDSSIVIPPQPTSPGEIMSGGEGEPVGADAPAEDETVSPQGTHVTGTQTVTHEYLTLNGKVARETIRTNNSLTAVLDFIYDESGKPFALKYSTNGTSFQTYYYVLNLQGDVVKLIHYIPGFEYESVATYEYDAWGNVSSSGRLAEINPLRYRGYYYDNETGFYYLQSRYYDPANRRFINADSYQSTGQGFVGTNMFAYCNNNPITAIDESGKSVTAIIIGALICAAIGGIDAYLSAKTSGASTNEALWQGAIGAVSGAVTSVVAAIPAIGPPAATLIGAGIGFVSSTASEVTHYAFNKDDPDYEFDTAEHVLTLCLEHCQMQHRHIFPKRLICSPWAKFLKYMLEPYTQPDIPVDVSALKSLLQNYSN